MLRKPSQRRSGRRAEDIELPLIPIMDAFVTLIAFLLLATSLLAVTLIDTPTPVVSNEQPEKLPKVPLALQLRIEKDELTLSSLTRKIPEQKFPKVNESYELTQLHDALVKIRLQFPEEKGLVFLPAAEVKYDDLVQLMDAARLLLKTDPPLPNYVDKEGVERTEQFVFPNVVFGNVISGI
jgi:biopolymer transport protein ExbD